MASPYEQRRWQLEHQAALAAKVFRISGTILVNGAGEAQHAVNFPVAFLEKPVLSFGGELVGSSPVAGKYPTISVVVLGDRWNRKDFGEGKEYYVGATLAVVTTGVDEQVMYAHWTFEGKALQNPIGSPTEAQ